MGGLTFRNGQPRSTVEPSTNIIGLRPAPPVPPFSFPDQARSLGPCATQEVFLPRREGHERDRARSDAPYYASRFERRLWITWPHRRRPGRRHDHTRPVQDLRRAPRVVTKLPTSIQAASVGASRVAPSESVPRPACPSAIPRSQTDRSPIPAVVLAYHRGEPNPPGRPSPSRRPRASSPSAGIAQRRAPRVARRCTGHHSRRVSCQKAPAARSQKVQSVPLAYFLLAH